MMRWVAARLFLPAATRLSVRPAHCNESLPRPSVTRLGAYTLENACGYSVQRA